MLLLLLPSHPKHCCNCCQPHCAALRVRGANCDRSTASPCRPLSCPSLLSCRRCRLLWGAVESRVRHSSSAASSRCAGSPSSARWALAVVCASLSRVGVRAAALRVCGCGQQWGQQSALRLPAGSGATAHRSAALRLPVSRLPPHSAVLSGQCGLHVRPGFVSVRRSCLLSCSLFFAAPSLCRSSAYGPPPQRGCCTSTSSSPPTMARCSTVQCWPLRPPSQR